MSARFFQADIVEKKCQNQPNVCADMPLCLRMTESNEMMALLCDLVYMTSNEFNSPWQIVVDI